MWEGGGTTLMAPLHTVVSHYGAILDASNSKTQCYEKVAFCHQNSSPIAKNARNAHYNPLHNAGGRGMQAETTPLGHSGGRSMRTRRKKGVCARVDKQTDTHTHAHRSHTTLSKGTPQSHRRSAVCKLVFASGAGMW